MKNRIRQIATFTANVFPFGIFKNTRIPFLPFYHLITDKTPPHIRHLYRAINPAGFEQHLDFFLKHFDLASDINDFKKKNCFFISFDDGLREVFDIAAPILKRKGVPAVFFVNSGFIGNTGLMYRYKASLLIDKLEKKQFSKGEQQFFDEIFGQKRMIKDEIVNKILRIDYHNKNQIDILLEKFEIDISTYLQGQKPYMDLDELKSLEAQGFYIGLHGHQHPDFRQLSEEERLIDLQKNMAWHQTNFPHQPKFFAFPFTDDGISVHFFERMKALGITASFGTGGLKNDVAKNHFQRLPIENYQGSIRQIVGGEYAYSVIKSIFGKNTVHRP